MPKIIYLEQKGGGYRSSMRADTLWGALCWYIRRLQDGGGKRVQDFIGEYIAEGAKPPFVLSSAYPWIESDGKRTHFLPAPLVKLPPSHNYVTGDKTPTARKRQLRKAKIERGKQNMMSWEVIDQRFGNQTEPTVPQVAPRVEARATPHNVVDRRRLGTLTVNGSGQLFHSFENYVEWKGETAKKDSSVRQGLYFLLDGDDPALAPALRLLSVIGIGGDRRTGKGNFKATIVDDAYNLPGRQFSLPRVKNPNSAVLLSPYHPGINGEDVKYFGNLNDDRFQYKLEERQGRNLQAGEHHQDGRLYFTEGSVFPKERLPDSALGRLLEMGPHPRYGHEIYRYAYAYLLDLKIPVV